MAKSAMKSPLFLLAVGVAAYWFWKNRASAAQAQEPQPGWSLPSFTPATSTSAGWDTSVQVPYRP